MKRATLHMIGNAHIDPVWLWQWPEGMQEVLATFRSALDRLSEDDAFCFSASSAAFYEWVEQADPGMFDEIRARVREGRWEIVGGWWIEPDCHLPAGESFARQALIGQRYFRSRFGVAARVGYNVDSFGHNGMLPQILKKSGLDYYVFMRPGPHEKGLPGRLFWWEADDGSRVLAFRLPFEYCTRGEGLENHVRRCAAEIKEPLDATMCFYGVGNHGGGPTVENIGNIRRLAGEAGLPTLSFSTTRRFFEAVELRNGSLPTVHDELTHHASGCYAAHSGIKRGNRRAENALLRAEKMASIAWWAAGQPYPTDLARAWKDVLFNQFHDVLAGTCLETAYEDAQHLYGEAMAIAGRALNSAMQAVAWRVQIPFEEGVRPILVCNPHAWPIHAPVELEIGAAQEGEGLVDDQGRPIAVQWIRSQAAARGRSRLCFAAELPPLGYRVYRLVKPDPLDSEGTRSRLSQTCQVLDAGAPLQPGPTTLENRRFRLEFDPQAGTLVSLYDKLVEVEVLSAPARAVVLEDAGDTWAHGMLRFGPEAGTFGAARLRVVEYGPVRAVLRVESGYGAASRLVQHFILYRDLDRIDVRVTVDWHEQHKMLKLRFPVNGRFMKATHEIAYGHVERRADGEEEPCQGWVDVSGIARDAGVPYGLSVLNDGKYSVDVAGPDIGLTVLRSPIYAHHIPYEPDPDDPGYAFIDQGVQHFTYALCPHKGSWEQAGTVRQAAELNQPPVALVGTCRPGGTLPPADSFLSIDAENIVVTALKKAEDGDDLIVRAYETSGRAVRATLCLPRWGRAVETTFGPCEIKTFRLPRDPGQPVIEVNLLEDPVR